MLMYIAFLTGQQWKIALLLLPELLQVIELDISSARPPQNGELG